MPAALAAATPILLSSTTTQLQNKYTIYEHHCVDICWHSSAQAMWQWVCLVANFLSHQLLLLCYFARDFLGLYLNQSHLTAS